VSQFVPAEVVAVSDPVGTTISESLNQATHWLNSEADRVESEQAAETNDSKNRRDQIWGLMLLRSDYRYQGFVEKYETSVSDRTVILNQILADYHTMKKGLAEYYQSKNFTSDLEDGSLLEYLEGKGAVPKSNPSDAALMALAEHLAPLTIFVEQIKNGDIPEYIVSGDASITNPKDFRVSDEKFKRLIKGQVEVFMAQEKTWINFSNLIIAQAGLFGNSAEEAKKVFEDLEKHSLYDKAFSKRIVDDLKKELITPSQASNLMGEYFQNLGMLKTDEIMGWTRIDPVNQAKVELKDLEKHMQDKLEELEKTNLSRKPASLKESGTKKGKK
jgi:hypothetical protein